MENSDFSKSLAAIIEKRRNCIPLTNAEEKLVNESLNKLLDAKKCVNKTLSHTTGDAIRKSGSSPVLPKAPSTDPKTEGVPPQDRGKAGGYEAHSDVAERQPTQATDAQPVAPVKVDTNLTDKKESTVPAATDKPDPKPYGDKTKEEWADVDNKKFKNEFYEEDKVGRITEHADYPESIKVSSIVVKTVGTRKVVGQVLKVYNTKDGQTGLMVKWSDGRFEHVNQSNVELLKTVKPEAAKTEKGLLATSLAEAGALAVGVGAADVGAHIIDNALDAPKKPKQPKIPKVPNPDSSTPDAATTKSVANAALGGVVGNVVAGDVGAVVGAGVGALTGNKPKDVKKDADDTPKTEKSVSGAVTGLATGALDGIVLGPVGAVVGAAANAVSGALEPDAKKPSVKKADEVTEKVTGALTPDEMVKAADPLPTEAPEEFIKGVVETLKELTNLSDEEIINVAKSAWQEIAAEQTAKAAKAKDVQKEMYDGESNVASTPTDRHDEVTPGSIGTEGETGNVLNAKCSAVPAPKK